MTAISRYVLRGRTARAFGKNRIRSPKFQYTEMADGRVKVKTYKVESRYTHLYCAGFRIESITSLCILATQVRTHFIRTLVSKHGSCKKHLHCESVASESVQDVGSSRHKWDEMSWCNMLNRAWNLPHLQPTLSSRFIVSEMPQSSLRI